MVLEEVDVVTTSGSLETEVSGIAYDSRRVRRGDVFFGLSGLKQDGQAYVRQAFSAGAVAAVVERDIHLPGVTLVRVDESRTALAQASARFFEHPSRSLRLVGVTGTNGKTTTTYMLDAVFREAGFVTGIVGTTGYHVAGEIRPAPFTTPEAPELQGLLRAMVDRGVGAAAVELSSHALDQKRCLGLDVDVAVFTNFTHDHLDYHGTLEAYLDAKLRLFDGRNQPRPAKRTRAVVNADDGAAPAVARAAASGGMGVLRYGQVEGADVRIAAVVSRPQGLELEIAEAGGRLRLVLPLLGRYNAWNAAAAFGAARVLGLEPQAIARGLERVAAVPGRLERVVAGQPFEVVVDYAHTPDALVRALAAVREHVAGRVLLVFGCGGDRDATKRPLMGRAAAEGADRAWVTNDNPRTESPEAIAADILRGVTGRAPDVELDRERAIAAALGEARPGDVVLIAGKGHETTQTFADRVVPFDDRHVARRLLSRRGGG
jgi:UDP-N-acetylmuramoyl-L-alanyl-D-glutamate--2,6-diaminopimelate ligase